MAHESSGELLLFPDTFNRFDELPDGMRKHLEAHRRELRVRAAFRRGNCLWWQYTWPLHAELYNQPRILSPFLATANRFALDPRQRFLGLTDTIVLFPRGKEVSLEYCLGLLNSKVLTWRFRFIGKLKGNGIREYFPNSVGRIPLRMPTKSQEDRALCTRVIECVQALNGLVANEEVATARKEARRQSILAWESKLDDLVRQIYGLSSSDYERICEDLSTSDNIYASDDEENDNDEVESDGLLAVE